MLTHRNLAQASFAYLTEVDAAAPGDSVLLQMLRLFVPAWLGGLLAAGIISAVMGSDCHQILGLSTMFTKDIYNYYGAGRRMGEHSTVVMGRAFILVANGIAYLIALEEVEVDKARGRAGLRSPREYFAEIFRLHSLSPVVVPAKHGIDRASSVPS